MSPATPDAAREKARLRQELAGRLGLGAPLRPPDLPDGRAAERLRRQPEYRRARVVAVAADPALLQVRINALNDGKALLAASPGLKEGLVRLTPEMVPLAARSRELTGHAMVKAGRRLRLPGARVGPVGLVVGAALAADEAGGLLGDGRGILDLFWALLRSLGAAKAETPLAVVLADEQLLDQPLPRQAHDAAAGLVVTPGRVLRREQAQPGPSLEGLPPSLARLPVVKALRG
jgi:5-formyltetrahydrofolate cyclo-ligase